MLSEVINKADWRQILKTNFNHWDKLADFLELNQDQRQVILKKPRFGLNLPMRLAEKIEKHTLNDPILRQFLPIDQELINDPLFILDPVNDQSFRKESCLLQKYEGRVLLLTTSACAMHCRFCFRQNFDYQIDNKTFVKEYEMIANDSSIHEVILSGGDPLSLPDHKLKEILLSLNSIPHIKRIRFHTRFPMGIPERITSDFLALFDELKAQIIFVIHANHPKEFDAEIFSKLKKLHRQGVVILHQAVLLKGVNDDASVLIQLCELLVNNGLIPYYLHQLDRVKGAHHFELDEQKGIDFINEVAAKLSGYAVPRYVKEIPGMQGKTPIKTI